MERVTRLTVSHADKEKAYTLRAPSVEIGRGSNNDVIVLDTRASRQHARLTRRGDNWEIEDLASANGTRVNGQFVSRAAVAEGDRIEIGDAQLVWRWVESGPTQDEPTLMQAPLLDNAADLERTLHDEPLEADVADTSLPRLAARLEGRIWETPLTGERLTIGRSADNDIVLPNDRVSRQHAVLERRGERIVLVDKESSNGTYVGSERITERELRGDEDIRIGGARLVFKPAFRPADLDTPPEKRALPRRPVMIVPGMMGSQLWRDDTMVWPDLRTLMLNPEMFSLPDKAHLTPRGIVNEVVIIPGFLKQEQYTRLVTFLTESLGYGEGADLGIYTYDWRRDLRLAARGLAEEVTTFRQQLSDPKQKVTILAHSMGCLVTRYYIDRLGGDQAVERCVLMGGPHLGTPKFIVSLLAGVELLPFGVLGERLRRVVATFHSVYQLLPAYPCVFNERNEPIDVYGDSRWLLEAMGDALQDGKAFRAELSTSARVPTTCIFGYGLKTVTKAIVQVDAEGRWRNPRFVEEKQGDNSVPETSAVLAGAEIHPVHQQHGTLFTDNDVRMRLKLELTRG